MMLWSLTALVLVSPLAFGAIRPWTATALAAGVGVLLLAWSIERLVAWRPPAVGLARCWPPLVCFAAVLGWLVLQTADFTPVAWHHPYWAEAAALLDAPVAGRISLDAEASWLVILRLASYGGIFWLALQLCRSRRRARRVFYAVAIAGLAYALYGLAVQAYDIRMVAWEPKVYYRDSLTSTFINRNSYATFAGFGLIVTLGLLLNDGLAERATGIGPREALRRATEYLQSGGWLLIAALAALAAALLLSKSRAGLFSTGLALLTLLAVPWLTGQLRLRAAALLATGILLLGFGQFAVSGAGVFARMFELTDLSHGGRAKIFAVTTEALADRPFLGTGAGTFEQVVPAYRREANEVGLQYRYNRAHNSYVENALEFGIPAAAVLYLGLGLIVAHCLRGIRRRRRDALFPAIGVAASVLAGVHSFFDFSLQIPAVAATYALILGAAAAQSWSSVEET